MVYVLLKSVDTFLFLFKHVICVSFGFFLSVIALKTGWQVEVSEKGDVRLWLQTESLSNSAELRLIFNDREISSTPVRTPHTGRPVIL